MILIFNKTQIYYEIQGTGPVYVLLHGFLESMTMWERLIPILTPTKTVITVDLPGHGKSGWVEKEHSMEMMAEIVDNILKVHSIDAITILGHSMGGYVALAYTTIYASSVQKLILLNSTPAEDSSERKINRDRALKLLDKNRTSFIAMAIPNLFTENTHEKYASEIQMMKNEASNFPLEGIKATILGMKNRKDRVSILKTFQGEKLMICGIHDPIVPFEDSKTLAKQTLTKMSKINGGHMGMIENFDEIVKFIT